MRRSKIEALPDDRTRPESWVAFLICHCLAGVAAGWTVVGGLLWLDVAGLGDLIMTSDLSPVPLLMLLAAFAITFGSAAMGGATMGLGRGGGSAGLAVRRLRPSRAAPSPRHTGGTVT